MSTLGVLRSALERMNELLKCETRVAMKEVLEGAIEQLSSDLGGVAETLSSSDAKRKVRELAYDIEDSVECFIRRQESNASKWSLRCLYKHSSDERSFLQRVQAISRRARDLMKTESSAHKDPSADLQVSIDDQPILDTKYRDQVVVIGLEEDLENVKELLVGPGQELGLTVIGICGMGGMGKTTLAQLAFDDINVTRNFSHRAWVTVGSSYQLRNIIVTLLSHLSPDADKKRLAAMETRGLTEMLYKSLHNHRYLLCLDDVWGTEIWDSLRFVFPDDHNGSRILITTRSMEVTRYTSMSGRTIQMNFLTEAQSLQLLLIKSGLQHDPGVSNLEKEKILKQIVRSCGGLPLAIVVTAQILSATSLQNWEERLQNQHSDQQEHVTDILDLSYKHLPLGLQPCFLYMGHFPSHQPISVDKLYLLWMAEGLISKREEAEDYFTKLVDRNMVIQVEKEYLNGFSKFKSSQVHELLRDLCISRGKEEEFFEVIDLSRANELSTSTCRLAVYLNRFDDSNIDVTFSIPDAKRIRSILFFDTVESFPKSVWPSEVADLSNFQRIRVLEFDGVNFMVNRLPRGIEKLMYLRHLSFRGCYLNKFPSSFDNFSFLVTLDLRVVDYCVMTIPYNVMRKMRRLRHLYFPLAFQCDGKDKLKLGCLTRLEVVENFNADSCDAEDLLQLENLQILTASVDGNNSDLRNIIESTKKMKSTIHSSLVVKRFHCYTKESRGIVAELLQCEAVHALDLEGHLGDLPRDVMFSKNFTKIVFNGSEFSEDPMPILGKLPKLRSVVLCNDAFIGSKLVCHESDFPQLTSLQLSTLLSLEVWEVEGGAMPCLTILTIDHCHKLVKLPFELVDIPILEKLMIGSMSQDFQFQITEQMKSAAHICQVTFYDC